MNDPVFDTRMIGLGKGFAPSATAAAKALGMTVRQDVHPPGTEGTNYSLNEMAKLIKEGRNDPRMRAFAGKVLMAAGKPKTVKGQSQAILDEIRKKTVYVQDPVNTELMAKPHVTLCLDEHGLCMPAADCDDRCIAFASATMSIGIETKIVGQAYGTSQATHVICAVLDPDQGWLKVDPSSEKYKVGDSYPATKEWWMDPISGSVSQSSMGAKTTLGEEPDHGDFIGVGAVPVTAPAGVGVFPMAHAFAIGADSASDVPVGMEGGLPCFPDGTPARAAKEYAFQQQMVRGVGAVPAKKLHASKPMPFPSSSTAPHIVPQTSGDPNYYATTPVFDTTKGYWRSDGSSPPVSKEMPFWKQYILNHLVPEGVVGTATGTGAPPTGNVVDSVLNEPRGSWKKIGTTVRNGQQTNVWIWYPSGIEPVPVFEEITAGITSHPGVPMTFYAWTGPSDPLQAKRYGYRETAPGYWFAKILLVPAGIVGTASTAGG